MEQGNKYSLLEEKLIEFYCIYKQIKDIKEEILLHKESILYLEQEKEDIEKVIISELKARDLESSSYKDILVKVTLKPNKESLSKEEKEKEVLKIVEDDSIDNEIKIKKIFSIMKPQDTGKNIEKLSVRKKKVKEDTFENI